MKSRPVLIYADAEGRIIDWPELEMVGRGGGGWRRLQPRDWIPMPEGSELFLLPSRLPVGYSPSDKRFQVVARDPFNPSKPVQAVAAFIAPAHTQIYSAAYQTLANAPLLPLFAYTAVGWHDDQFVVAAIRVDADERQDFRHFNARHIERNARRKMKNEVGNRLIQHLGKCALSYGCPAARNLFMERWEAPLPTSPACNARCLGCISLQRRRDLRATQDRIGFVPTAEEIAGVAVPHLKKAPRAVVSFGQGCEGEPLLQEKTIDSSIRIMRQETPRGTINVNTNGSLPGAVEKLCRAGMNSMRVSLNSCRPEYYHAYFNPRGYSFSDVRRSISTAKHHGTFVSLNYFVLPGFTDQEEELSSLCSLVDETGIDLIQMRNLNIDPEWYLDSLHVDQRRRSLGIRRLLELIKERFPDIRLGYFNPSLDPEAKKPGEQEVDP